MGEWCNIFSSLRQHVIQTYSLCVLDRSPFTTYTRLFGAQSFHALSLGRAGVAELVDAQVLGTCGAIRGGSIPSARTTCAKIGCAIEKRQSAVGMQNWRVEGHGSYRNKK